MGFMIYSVDDGRVPSFHEIPCAIDGVKPGIALTLASGTAVLATATTKPSYIAVGIPRNGFVQAIRVDSDIVFETTCSAAVTSVDIGTKLTLHTDGAQVTATATNGIAELVYKESGGASGCAVRVRF